MSRPRGHCQGIWNPVPRSPQLWVPPGFVIYQVFDKYLFSKAQQQGSLLSSLSGGPAQCGIWVAFRFGPDPGPLEIRLSANPMMVHWQREVRGPLPLPRSRAPSRTLPQWLSMPVLGVLGFLPGRHGIPSRARPRAAQGHESALDSDQVLSSDSAVVGPRRLRVRACRQWPQAGLRRRPQPPPIPACHGASSPAAGCPGPGSVQFSCSSAATVRG